MDTFRQQAEQFVPPQEILEIEKYTQMCAEILSCTCQSAPKAYVHTYGCQGNVSDSERLKGFLRQMGCEFTMSPEDADIVLFNTCAVREHAEDRVFGNVGALKPIKVKRPNMIIALCGCMMQQSHVAERIRHSYPYVNIVFGTYALYRFPVLLYRALSTGKRVFDTEEESPKIAEGLPSERDRGARAYLPIMYGCNNFCTYCVVPYVRGRERSRRPQDIIDEAHRLIDEGVKDITLLGQNVNSYGNGCGFDVDFADIIREINSIDGDFLIRFMTSHPKDCTKKLLDTMAECEKAAKHLHLPFQSGSNRVLRAMNRSYTREKYISLVEYARSVMPDISLTSDVIVGFPGETREDFEQTLSLLETVKFTSLYTFIYSRRQGTRAAEMDDFIPAQEKSAWFRELLDVQERIASERTAQMVGKIFRTLVEPGDDPEYLTGRTSGNVTILFSGPPELIGQFVNLEVTRARTWILYGRLA